MNAHLDPISMNICFEIDMQAEQAYRLKRNAEMKALLNESPKASCEAFNKAQAARRAKLAAAC